MKAFNFLLIIALLSATIANGQTVPETVLAKVTRLYTGKNMKLEKTYLPDLEHPERNALFKAEPCYTGKKVTVVAVTGIKPKNWFFKVRYNDKVNNKDPRNAATMTVDGINYRHDHITVSAPSPAMHNSDHCMTILAYDVSDMKLPVYILVFTSDQ